MYSPHRPIPQEYISGNSVRDCGKDWDFNRYSIGCDIWYDTFCKTEFCFIKVLKSVTEIIFVHPPSALKYLIELKMSG